MREGCAPAGRVGSSEPMTNIGQQDIYPRRKENRVSDFRMKTTDIADRYGSSVCPNSLQHSNWY